MKIASVFYWLGVVIICPFALAYEGGCRWSDRNALHAKPRSIVRASGRHTHRYLTDVI